MLAGGTDASLSPYGLVTQLSNGRLSRRGDPARAYLPFDDQACGYVPGEGGAMLVLEHPDAYRERGGYGEIARYAATLHPPPSSGRPPHLPPPLEAAPRDSPLAPRAIPVGVPHGA